ncbi:UDP-4-amino-4-deoxy-L-arabinose--oxoglutarate aminotransferase [Rosistilla oblonga]|uniref:UDP-4-amino-4, 6-dideoxy-N-acetyl-beta-L-altrosamine transaminase n=1 Tax=Rosistilla oblonga TaxID=2527990 RepID=UPI001188330A|nr:UDP-4-amino-4,6-dideoxy-N-acetyl-beta-L-altrosamine transaminase [Rosistilla oblonga]QDV11928.1 UDP-4-amino-4-deoxy-L-arabinose--oxoglutarate aminotransferase [Rosistilla oblonga]
MIPYGKQSIDEADIQAVVDALRSDFLTTGPRVAEFERRFSEAVGAKHAIAVCNATAALHLAMLVAEVRPGDRVVTSPNTFLASANAAAFAGAVPDFVDIDPVSYNLCPDALRQNWKDDTKAVVAVDYAGQAADMPALAAVARTNGAVVIEDACHAVAGQFQHEEKTWKIGGHPWADLTTFSFHPVKTMTTGEGGMLVTNNDQYAARARALRTHGMVRSSENFDGLGDPSFEERGPWYYEMQHLGYNYRITDLQCALGLSQIERLEAFLSRRRSIVAEYNAAFSDIQTIQTPRLRNPADASLTSWHLYTLQIDFDALTTTRTEFMRRLHEQGVGTQVLYIPVHLQPWYRKMFDYRVGKCPVAERFYQRALSLPLYPAMSDQDVQHVIGCVTRLSVVA